MTLCNKIILRSNIRNIMLFLTLRVKRLPKNLWFYLALKMWQVGGKVVAGTFSPPPWPSACQQILRVRPLPWVRLALRRPHRTLPLPPAPPLLPQWPLSYRALTPRSLPSDPPSQSADQPSLLPSSISFITLQPLSTTTCCLHLWVLFCPRLSRPLWTDSQRTWFTTDAIYSIWHFQMCAKETRETPTADNVTTTAATPARFDNKPTFRPSYAKPELVK